MQGEVGPRCSPGLILMWHQLVHQNLLYLPSKSQETTKQQIMFFLEALWHKVLIRDQREWVFEVREVKSEKEKLSLFFEK